MILPLVFILFLQKLYGQFFLPQSCVIVNGKEKVVGLYESDGSPITVTHVIKLWKKLCQSVVVDMWKGQTSHVFLEVKFVGEFEI